MAQASSPYFTVADDSERLRIDKWLWAARFYKTRALASAAVAGGHVHVNGQRVKPARTVGANDVLEIRKAGETFTITVRTVSDRRGPASAAQQLYDEHDDSRRARELHAEQRKLDRLAAPVPGRRPDRRGRREVARLKGRSG